MIYVKVLNEDFRRCLQKSKKKLDNSIKNINLASDKKKTIMHIDKIEFVAPYKCIETGTVIDFSGRGNYCALVGLNGSGKSSIIDCLNYSFNHGARFLRRNNPNSDIDYIGLIINNKIEMDNGYKNEDLGLLPKFVIYNYNGESKMADNIGDFYMYGKWSSVVKLQLNYRIWHIVYLILQVLDDPIVNTLGWRNRQLDVLRSDAEAKYRQIVDNVDLSEDEEIKRKRQIIQDLCVKKEIFTKMGFQNMTKNMIRNRFGSYSIRALIYNVINEYMKQEHRIKQEQRYAKKYGNSKETHNNIFYELFDNVSRPLYKFSEGQKKLLVLKLIMYLADEDTLVLLDEPDTNLDIQKKRELFEMISSCKGQVILTTHDPIMTKWMKDHLVFMKDGKQIQSELVDAINKISEGEVSYQETMLVLSECKHFVFVEGKTDIAFIRKAIDILGYSQRFENVTFLTMGSSGAVEDKFYTTICKYLPKDTQKILFLFDADAAGYNGKKQIDELTELKNQNIDDLLKQQQECRDDEYKQKLGDKISRIKETDFDLLDKITYCFYGNNDDFSATQDGDRIEWFYLEDYFNVNTYPYECMVRKKEIKEYFKGLIPENETENDEILKFRELEAFGQRCKNQKYSNNASRIKNYFKDKLYMINDRSDFEPFGSLLDVILEKLELKPKKHG